MTGIWILAALLATIWVVRLLRKAKIVRVTPGTLRIVLDRRVENDHFGEPETLLYVSFFGSLHLPEHTSMAAVRVRIFDVTDPDSRLPVRSLLDGATDQNGMFEFNFPFPIPNGTYLFRQQELCSINLDGLLAPYHGGRTYEVEVQFRSDVDETVSSVAVETINVPEVRHGYLEVQEVFEQAASLEQQLADLFSLSDGTSSITEIQQCINALLAMNVSGLADSAYERCLQSLGNQSAISTNKRALLDQIAQQLALPAGLIARLNDRYLRLSMMDGMSDLEVLGIPLELPVEEQRTLLAAEYRKWRARATHTDPAIAAEATSRLESIARARAALS